MPNGDLIVEIKGGLYVVPLNLASNQLAQGEKAVSVELEGLKA